MKFTLSIDLSNEAMNDKHDISAVLLHLAYKLRDQNASVTKFDREAVSIRDKNGNHVGAYSFR